MINKFLGLVVASFILVLPEAYASYCQLELTPSRTLTGECILAEQHYGFPGVKPYLEVTAHGNNGAFSKLYAKVLRVSSSGSPNSIPRFIDPNNDGEGRVLGKIRVSVRGWNDEYITVNASIDGSNYTIWQGRLR